MATGVVAVIPTYCPPNEVVGLIGLLSAMVDEVCVADDGSPCTFDEILRESSLLIGAPVRRFRANAGIARSLNHGLAAARRTGANWLLTVDQDTRIPDDLVPRLLDVVATASVRGVALGAVGPETIVDRGTPLAYPVQEADGLRTTEEIFQTCALWSVRALDGIGGFDEDFGIDAVDSAACLRLRRAGYAIALAPDLAVDHAYGDGRSLRILGRTVVATNHSPARRESMTRNRLALVAEEWQASPTHALRTIRRLGMNTVLALTIEDDRLAKARATFRGLRPRGRR